MLNYLKGKIISTGDDSKITWDINNLRPKMLFGKVNGLSSWTSDFHLAISYLFLLNGIEMSVIGGRHYVFLLIPESCNQPKPHLATKWKQSASQRNS